MNWPSLSLMLQGPSLLQCVSAAATFNVATLQKRSAAAAVRLFSVRSNVVNCVENSSTQRKKMQDTSAVTEKNRPLDYLSSSNF